MGGDRRAPGAHGLLGTERYVSALGFDKLPLDHRPGLPPNAPLRRVFEQPTINGRRHPAAQRESGADLCRLLQGLDARLPAVAMDNVGYEGGREITPEQNDRLGAILRTVAA